MTILLTGATGFIGKEIRKQGLAEYRCVSRRSQDGQDDTFAVESIDAQTSWSGAFDHCDAVIHLAGVAHNKGSSVDDFYEINYKGTMHLARSAASAGVKRFVFVSTVGVLGNGTDSKGLTNHSSAAPHNDYAKSKWLAEQALLELQDQCEMDVVIVRPPLVYGSEAPGNFGALAKLVKLFPLLPFGLVKNRRSIISCSNLADFLYRCCYLPEAAGKAWLVAERDPVSTRELVRQIALAQGKSCWQLPVPTSLMYWGADLLGKRAMAEQLLGDLVLEVDETFEKLGWAPPYTMQQGLSCNQKEEL
jgi:nucleoside-diphosphate-sugar epimerase